MLFNSIDFFIFFPIVLIIYYIIPDKVKHFWLLIASYYFYMCWNAKYVVLIMSSTIITYASGLIIEKIKGFKCTDLKRDKYKKWVVAGSFIINLGILFYFKYFEFSLNLAAKVLEKVHIQMNVPAFDIILPVGISFYTFQAVSYTMDVYRGEIYAEKNFIRYALFVSFFPQLVAGPIERSKNLLKQLAVPKPFDFDRAKDGFLLMIWGYFQKVVLADRIAIFVDTVYGDYQTYGGWYIIVATMLFAIQIYCDFAGYSTIAMGAAKILGINLMENFNAPYLSTSVADFWRRWHISLTSWFRDYLYIPLGGNRKGKLRKYLNTLTVFLVSGLWHGANLSFVIWGGLNGLYQIISEILEPLRKKIIKERNTFSQKLIKIIGTFILVDFSWIFFRAPGLRASMHIIKSLLTVRNPWVLFDGSLYTCGLNQKNYNLMLICILILAVVDLCKHNGICVREKIAMQDAWFQIVIVAASVIAIVTFGIWGGSYDSSGFIYFQF